MGWKLQPNGEYSSGSSSLRALVGDQRCWVPNPVMKASLLGCITTVAAWSPTMPLARPTRAHVSLVAPADEIGSYALATVAGALTTGILGSFVTEKLRAEHTIATSTAVEEDGCELLPRALARSPPTSVPELTRDTLRGTVVDAPSSLHQSMQPAASFTAYADMGFEQEEEVGDDWWVCPMATLEENCKEIFYDGEIQVACAY